jgi:hypothetical protein
MAHHSAGKTRFHSVRMSMEDAEALLGEARHSGLTLSELVRRRISGQVVVSRTDEETAESIDQLGRMLKNLYPKGQGWVSPEERKRWWTLVTELERTARELSCWRK